MCSWAVTSVADSTTMAHSLLSPPQINKAEVIKALSRHDRCLPPALRIKIFYINLERQILMRLILITYLDECVQLKNTPYSGHIDMYKWLRWSGYNLVQQKSNEKILPWLFLLMWRSICLQENMVDSKQNDFLRGIDLAIHQIKFTSQIGTTLSMFELIKISNFQDKIIFCLNEKCSNGAHKQTNEFRACCYHIETTLPKWQ